MATIQQHREALQDLLVSGVLTSTQVQIISLVYFARKLGYKPIDGDIRKGFVYRGKANTAHSKFSSLVGMQHKYNRAQLFNPDCDFIIVEEVGLVYHKRTTREISSQKEYLKFNF